MQGKKALAMKANTRENGPLDISEPLRDLAPAKERTVAPNKARGRAAAHRQNLPGLRPKPKRPQFPSTFAFAAGLAGSQLLAAAAPASHTALVQAVRNGEIPAIHHSIATGVDINAHDDRGNTALHLAALNLDASTMAILVRAGANPNATNIWGDTPLIYSASSLDKVQLLLTHGANVNAQATNGASVLSAAGAFPDSYRVVRYLLDHGAKLNPNQPVEIRSAVLGGDLETVKLLLARGARAKSDSPDHLDSPLVLAAALDHEPIAQVLIKSSGRSDPSTGLLNAGFHWSAFAQKVSEARSLVRSGADLHRPFRHEDFLGSPRADGTLPLHWAVYNEQDDPELVQLILKKGAEVNAVNGEGETALDWANKRGHHRIIAALTEAGGKPGNRRAKSKPVPHRAVPSSGVAREQFIRDSVTKALALLEQSSDVFLESGLAKEVFNCVSCHHQSFTAVAANWANARGLRPDAASLRKILDATLRQLEPEVSRCYEGIVPCPNPGIENGYMLLALDALGHPADAVTDALVWQLAASQDRDGSWPWIFTRPPLEHGQVKATALAVKSLRTYPLPSRKKEFAQRIERARAWLERANAESPTELAFQLLGLGWAGAKPDAIRKVSAAILAAQKGDGGWASLPNLESDAWMTGLNLVALHDAGGVKVGDLAYRRGADFLLRTQFDDGSWWVRSRTLPALPHFDSQFPHGRDQFISAAGTGWATMALVLTLEVTQKPSSLRAQMAALPAAPGPSAASVDRPARAKSGNAAPSFQKDIQPLLERSCTGCHDAATRKGGLNAETLAGLKTGGQSGNPAVIPGHAAASPLIRLVSDQVEDLEMPPLAKRPKYAPLTKEEIQKLSLWIDQGTPE